MEREEGSEDGMRCNTTWVKVLMLFILSFGLTHSVTGTVSTTSNGTATFIFFDDFNRPDSTDMGSGWTEYGTTDWQIKNNAAYLPNQTTGQNFMVYATSGGSLLSYSDIIVEARLNVTQMVGDGSNNNDPHIGIVARGNTATDNSHRGYSLDVRTTITNLQLLDEQTAWKASTTTTQALNEWWNFELQVNGTSMNGKAWKDGTTEPSSWMVQDTSTTVSSGYVGLTGFEWGTSEQYYDDFRVRKYAATPPTYSIGAESAITASNELSDAGWTAKRPITISNSGSSVLTDYQMKIIVPYYTGMQSDFGDVRFMNGSENTQLPYWIESQNDGSNATVWVKVDTIPTGDSTIYLYYNTGIPPLSINQSSYNETSDGCTKWRLNTSDYCNTTDSTPTVKFSVNQNAYCAIGVSDSNYTTLIAGDPARNCTTTGGTSQVCTLPVGDALSSGPSNLYIGCERTDGTGETTVSISGPLAINLVVPPVVNLSINQSSYNETSDGCTKWRLNTSDYCNTTNSTPTVTFDTNLDAFCAISVTDINYTAMVDGDPARNCTTTGGTSQVCTLPVGDALVGGHQYLYIGCENLSGGGQGPASMSGGLAINYVPPVPINLTILQSTYNLTEEDCTKWRVNTSDYCNTTNSTPTVTFDTNLDAFCAIGVSDLNYTAMVNGNPARNCTTTGGLSHVCTLPIGDNLSLGPSNLYIGCENLSGGGQGPASLSGPLAVSVHEPPPPSHDMALYPSAGEYRYVIPVKCVPSSDTDNISLSIYYNNGSSTAWHYLTRNAPLDSFVVDTAGLEGQNVSVRCDAYFLNGSSEYTEVDGLMVLNESSGVATLRYPSRDFIVAPSAMPFRGSCDASGFNESGFRLSYAELDCDGDGLAEYYGEPVNGSVVYSLAGSCVMSLKEQYVKFACAVERVNDSFSWRGTPCEGLSDSYDSCVSSRVAVISTISREEYVSRLHDEMD